MDLRQPLEGRTSCPPKDIIEIIKANAAVKKIRTNNLGSKNKIAPK